MADRKVKRRLAAILAADVAGYTRLMETDTDGTVAAWQDAREEVIKPSVTGHSGTIVKLTGDGFLVEFPSVQDAVNCAIAMQEGLAASSLDFRMGVNMGDIVDDGEDIHSEGVNVAARLEGLADPGGICISGMVYESVRNRIEANYEDRGEQEVKNVSAPVRAYAIRLDSAPAAADAADPPLPDKPSIAVLPFDNLSGDPEQDYFADGMTEDIITDLSKISGLFVIARNSSFSYKGQSTDPRRIADELGVRNVLEGSVRKAGNRVRINAQLVDAVSGGHLWAERYDGDLDDIFSLQDEITGKIVTSLEVKLTDDELERERNNYVPNWEAYDCFIKGRNIITEHYFRFSRQLDKSPSEENLVSARIQFERAIELDSGFAGGYAGLSWTYSLGVRHGLSSTPDSDQDLAMQLANQAIEADVEYGWSYTALASAQLVERHHGQVISSARQAIGLLPNDSDGYAYLGLGLICAGKPEDALAPLQEALRLDPQYQPRTRSFLGIAYFGLGRFKETVQELEMVIGQLDYAIHFSLAFLASAYVRLARTEDAKETVQRLLHLYPGFTIDRFRRLWPYKDPADMEFACDDLNSAGLPETIQANTVAPLPDKPSIAVLPFENLSDDADQEYFSDGITEDIITGLSRIRQFLVIARNTTFIYKGKAVDVQAVAHGLGVRYVLEGSVRKSGARVRISVQLIDGETGNHIWAERYEPKLEDIFDIQDEITGAVIGAIAPELSRAEQDRARKKSLENLDGWDYFQRGMWHFNKMSAEEVGEARRLFEAAARCAPEFSGAHAALGYVAAVEALSGYTDDRAATLEGGLRDAERAVALDDRDGFNQFALGRVAIRRRPNGAGGGCARKSDPA
jgi:adenylate cyclase